MVISMAIPSATLKIKTVEGFNGVRVHPITPAVIRRGIMFGIREQSKMRNDLNKYSIHKAINRKAHNILVLSPFIINWLPSRKVTLEPVSLTLYCVLLKILLA